MCTPQLAIQGERPESQATLLCMKSLRKQDDGALPPSTHGFQWGGRKFPLRDVGRVSLVRASSRLPAFSSALTTFLVLALESPPVLLSQERKRKGREGTNKYF